MSFEENFRYLSSPVLSHSSCSRLSALRLLSSSLVHKPSSLELVLSRLIQAEEVPINAPSSRERVLRLTQLEHAIILDDTLVSELVVRWVVAQLKVGLRPVWVPAARVLEKFSEQNGELVWRIMFEELQEVLGASSAGGVPEWMKDAAVEGDLDEVRESERSWRDPSAHKVRSALAKWAACGTFRAQLIRVCVVYVHENRLSDSLRRISNLMTGSTQYLLKHNYLSLSNTVPHWQRNTTAI